MTEYIITIITVVASFVAAYFASTLSMKNVKQEKYFEEKKRLYYELATILPIVEEFETQSDYMDGSEGFGDAESKIPIMKIQLEDAKSRKENLRKMQDVSSEQVEDIETEISNLEYKIKKHEKYLIHMKELNDKINEFEKAGNKNLLRIFASTNVWNSYVRFKVALSNEYNCSIWVKTEDIACHINALIYYMRMDFSGVEK